MLLHRRHCGVCEGREDGGHRRGAIRIARTVTTGARRPRREFLIPVRAPVHPDCDRVSLCPNRNYFDDSKRSISWKVTIRKIRAVLSQLAVTTRCPSGENAALTTELEWPSSFAIT